MYGIIKILKNHIVFVFPETFFDTSTNIAGSIAMRNLSNNPIKSPLRILILYCVNILPQSAFKQQIARHFKCAAVFKRMTVIHIFND